MPRINLLPWREGQRKDRKNAFLVALAVSAIAAGVTAFAAYLLYGSMIEGQQHRNDRLRAEIKTLDKQNEEINNLETQKQKFIARMEIIEKLQRSRPEIVHVFDEIVRTLPEGVYLTAIKQSDKKVKFEGVAQSSTRVSSFMRNIDGSQWLRNPTDDNRAPVQQMIADLQASMAAAASVPASPLDEARREQIHREVRASLEEMFGSKN